MHTLTKKEVETLLDTYDQDPVNSLRTAVNSLLGVECPTWEAMMTLLPPRYSSLSSLAQQETTAMDNLVKQLVEHRVL